MLVLSPPILPSILESGNQKMELKSSFISGESGAQVREEVYGDSPSCRTVERKEEEGPQSCPKQWRVLRAESWLVLLAICFGFEH